MANFFNPSSLSQEQQDLLIAALQSNRSGSTGDVQPPTSATFDFASGSMESPIFSNFTSLDTNGLSNQPFLDYLGNDDSLNYGSVNPEDILDDPTSPTFDEDDDDDDDESPDSDLHDKRKSPGDPDEMGHGAKRREGEEKVARKPGRKPLTTEPTSKRKAQNRAAQRAFRERKEKHLKDLETKVDELEKTSESVNHENGLLRAQVEKLTSEVKEYRKKLSVSTASKTSPVNNIRSFSTSTVGSIGPNWNLEYPLFGSPTSYNNINNNIPAFNRGMSQSSNTASELLGGSFSSRHTSADKSSPNSQGATPMGQFLNSPHASISAESPNSNNVFKPADTPLSFPQPSDSPKPYNIFTSAGQTTNSPQSLFDNNALETSNSNQSQSRLFQFNGPTSGSGSSSDSPSSHVTGPSSSCGTSPEPSGQNGTSKELESINENTAMITQSMSNSIPTATLGVDGFDYFGMNNQPKDPFAPMSWLDYSDNTNAFFGGDAMFGNYTEDTSMSNTMDMFAPMNWNDLSGNITGLTPAVQKSDPMEEVKKPASLPCHKIWDKLSSLPQVKDGSIDIDGLCTELKQKAKCSETGIIIEEKDIEEALLRTKRTPSVTN